MAKIVPLLRGSSGLNTVNDPVRIRYSSKSGISDLAVGLNITISPSNRINRRKGKTLIIPLGSHSIFCDGGECVFVHDSKLYLLETNFSYRVLQSLSFNDQVAYTQVGDRIYYTNNQDLGYVEDGIRYAWEKTTEYVGPVTQKTFTGPFAGNHLAYHGGRIYISKDNILWYSEYAAHNWYDMARNFIPFNTKIRIIKPVEGGLFVSTSKAIYFLEGKVPGEFIKRTKTSYPALKWSDAIDYLDGANIPEFEISGLCALWSTPEGAMLGTPEGNVINLNKNKVIYPHGTKGSSLLRGLNFIHTIE
ncbi:MAG: hypothetical protein IMF11_09035 [Proteobacteria bacterium]|nr:hypothetical protein [Pseudomonadota bacterium]